MAAEDEQLVIDARGPGEWIVDAPTDGRALHIYRLGAGDWLVSEVGRRSAGRGANLRAALATLSDDGSRPSWWDAIPGALSENEAPAGA